MAGYNRHLREDPEVIGARVRGNVIVESGDLMLWNPNDNYAEPFSKNVGTTAPSGIDSYFLGMAMEGSPSGSTEIIGIAQAGVVRFPLASAGAVTVGSKVSAVSPHPVTTGVSPQYVTNSAAKTIHGTTAYLGYIVKSESGASYVDFQMRSVFGPGGIVT